MVVTDIQTFLFDDDINPKSASADILIDELKPNDSLQDYSNEKLFKKIKESL